MIDLLKPVTGCKVIHKLHKDILGLVDKIHNEYDDFWVSIRLKDNQVKDIPLNNIKCGFQCGDYIEHISDKSFGVGKVMALRTIADCEMVLVQFTNTALNKWLPYQVLRHIMPVETRAIHGILGNEADHAERFRLRVLSKALQFWDENTGALGRLGIDPLPHQVYVAQKVITSGNYSWLIADDVGLGKTIEVGLILHALTQRKICKRMLVVCPSGLVKNWQNEMKNKFEKDFSIYNIDFTPDNSDKLYLNGGDCVIISLDLAKKEKHKNIIINGKWDIVIFDEAHRLNKTDSGQESERYKLAKELRQITDYFILLTATPHQGKSKPFQHLLELVRPDLKKEISIIDYNPDILSEMIIRNSKIDVTNNKGEYIFKGHDTHRYAVPSSEDMKNFDVKLRKYFQEGYKKQDELKQNKDDRGRSRAIGFVMTTYRKLASSSIASILKALEKRHEKLCQDFKSISLTDNNYDNLEGFEDFIEEFNNDGKDDIINDIDELNTIPFFSDEVEQIKELIHLAKEIKKNDYKLETFLSKIIKPFIKKNENILIFTEYRETQNHIEQAIKNMFSEINISLINGSMSLDDRINSIDKFNAKENLILISTEAGGEGINLQENCHIMVNYDLPWNPSRLVQRIGRLYRYGQSKRVQVLNLHLDDNFDEQALDLMISRVEQTAKDMAKVDTRNREGLISDILGNLLSHIDIDDILSKSNMQFDTRTEQEIQDAINKAKEASKQADDILKSSDKYHGNQLNGFDYKHMQSFVEAMIPHMNAKIRSYHHNNETLEIELPTESIGKYSEFGKHQIIRCSTNPEITRLNRGKIYPLDFKSSFVLDMVKKAQSRIFDGLYSCMVSENDYFTFLGVFYMRWQDKQGNLLEQEIIPVCSNKQNVMSILEHQHFSNFLSNPLESLQADDKIKFDLKITVEMYQNIHKTVEDKIKNCIQNNKFPALLSFEAATKTFNVNDA